MSQKKSKKKLTKNPPNMLTFRKGVRMNKSIILNDIEQMIKTKYIDPLAKIKFSKLNDHFNNKNVLGVYFVFNEKKELIYVGQSGANKNSDSTWGLKNRINQHQSKSDRGAKNFGVKPDYVRDNYFFSYISLTEKNDKRTGNFFHWHLFKSFKV